MQIQKPRDTRVVVARYDQRRDVPCLSLVKDDFSTVHGGAAAQSDNQHGPRARLSPSEFVNKCLGPLHWPIR